MTHGILLYSTPRQGSHYVQTPIQRNVQQGAAARGVDKPTDLGPAEVNNVWSDTSVPPYIRMAGCLVKYSDNVTFA